MHAEEHSRRAAEAILGLPALQPSATLRAALHRAFAAGWEATKTGNSSHPEGRETAFGMFLRGFNFGDDEAGEDLTRLRVAGHD